jgi:ElaB/YqjD/DUF883 family membrane-anchored ribosome-binding protein
MDETRTTAEESATVGKLVQDFKVVVQDAEALLKATAGDVGERVREARERLATSMESAKANYQVAQGRAIEGVKAADKVVRSHPYESLGVAFGVGVVLGLLVGRK